MKINYEIKQANSPFEDTSFMVRNVYKKSAFLFDCGRIGSFSNSEVLSITDIFISHTHIDHFYGFDRILRGSILADKTINIYGPPGIIKNVRGKIDGYTWNLIKSYSIIYKVIELRKDTDEFDTCTLSAYEGFEPVLGKIRKEDIDLGDGFSFDFEFFEHRVPSVGYKISEPDHIVVDKEKLGKSGFKSGKWVGRLKELLDAGEKDGELVVLAGDSEKSVPVKELEEKLISYVPAQKITFMTDIGPSFDNYKKGIEFAKGSTVLLIEGMFLKEDVLHANHKRHLTLDMSKSIFNKSGAKKVRFFHFAPRYDFDRKIFFSRLYDGIEGKVL